ncbi:hypothetical protein ACLB1R_31860 [Escherichia coli]
MLPVAVGIDAAGAERPGMLKGRRPCRLVHLPMRLISEPPCVFDVAKKIIPRVPVSHARWKKRWCR